MITLRLIVKNFRSIKSQELNLAPITLIYGPNGTGKSSLLYALLTLKNIILNPSRHVIEFFNLKFLNLGDLKEVIFDHNTSNELELGIIFDKEGFQLDYRISILENVGVFSVTFSGPERLKGHRKLRVSFPYPVNKKEEYHIIINDQQVRLYWTGLTWEAETVPPDISEKVQSILEILNSPIELLKQIGFIPLMRGFNKPHYSISTTVSPLSVTFSDEEVASLLANDRFLEYTLSSHLNEIFGKDLRIRVKPGTTLFTIDTLDKSTALGVSIINEGFGINQLVYLLTLSLYKDFKIVCIEEPEIHLHPSAVRKLAQILTKIAKEQGKIFIISTHSEPLVVAFLSLVANGKLSPSDLACYLAVKDGKISIFRPQKVNEKGQIEGGLRSFMEGELEEVATFLDVRE